MSEICYVKRFIRIVVLLLFIQPQISNSVVWLNYIFQQDYITKTFCVNTDKPELNCNGKCHLTKQLSNQENQESEAPEPINLNLQLDFFFEDLQSYNWALNSEVEQSHHISNGYYYFPSLKLDKPPKS